MYSAALSERNGKPTYIVFRDADVRVILHDPRFSSRDALPLSSETTERIGGPPITVFTTDGTMHRDLRAPINKALHASRTNSMRPRISALAHELVDTFVHEGHADLIHQYATKLSAQVMLSMFGVPERDLDQVVTWGDHMQLLLAGAVSVEQEEKYNASYQSFQRYMFSLIQERVETPGNDMISLLLAEESQSRVKDGPSIEIRVANSATGLLTAGHENMRHGIGSTLYFLLRDPHRWRDATVHVDELELGIGEALRLRPPGKAFYRTTEEDVTIASVPIPRDAMLLLMFASSNHDEKIFGHDAEAFCPHRVQAKRPLTFGEGSHFCPGKPLSLVVTEIAITVLRERIPEITLAAIQELRNVDQLQFLGFEHLPVEWSRS